MFSSLSTAEVNKRVCVRGTSSEVHITAP